MRKRIGRGLRWFCVLVVAGLVGLGCVNAWDAARLKRPVTAPLLSVAQKNQVTGALRLQRELGDQIWPGFAATEIPVILFTDRYEFLVSLSAPPGPWAAVPGDNLAGAPYFRREAKDPQAFAVRVGDRWVASMGALDRLNREIFLNLRRELPPVLAQLIPYGLVARGDDFGQVALTHEMFHVHQAVMNPARFDRSEALFRQHQKRYPYGDAAFAAAWDREGKLLAAALKAQDREQARRLAAEFLVERRERRGQAGLSAELVAMEQEREWLEGLALYVEIRSHEAAAAAGWTGFSPNLRSWQTYFQFLERDLGRQGSDTRFYASGMAIARLLDRLEPDWKNRALGPAVTLEALLGSM